jgi:hypothetical protein
MENKGLVFSLLFAAIVSGVFCLWSINHGAPTAKESLLLAFILTICTTIASLLITQYYAEKSSRRELHTFAKKAAEKVTNLSKQMDVLSASLQQELDDSDYESPKEALLARDMTVESTIRMLGTLKSVNDGSLSDWQGVIGQEITAQRQEREKQEGDLRVIVERLGALGADATKSNGGNREGEDDEGRLRNEVDEIKRDVRVLAAQVGGVPVRRAKARSTKEEIRRNCPNCNASIVYRQRAKPNSFKLVECPQCMKHLYSRFGETGFVLMENKEEALEIQCPGCDSKLPVQLGFALGSSKDVQCAECSRAVQTRRQPGGVSVAFVDAAHVVASVAISEDLLQKVTEAMPPQPWPDGAAGVAAKAIGIPKSTMSSAISELIRRGVFRVQVDGQLYAPIISTSDRRHTVSAIDSHSGAG